MTLDRCSLCRLLVSADQLLIDRLKEMCEEAMASMSPFLPSSPFSFPFPAVSYRWPSFSLPPQRRPTAPVFGHVPLQATEEFMSPVRLSESGCLSRHCPIVWLGRGLSRKRRPILQVDGEYSYRKCSSQMHRFLLLYMYLRRLGIHGALVEFVAVSVRLRG